MITFSNLLQRSTGFVFFLLIFISSLLLGQDTESSPNPTEAKQNEQTSLQPAPSSPLVPVPSSEETSPGTSSPSSASVDSVAPVDPSAEALPGSSPENSSGGPIETGEKESSTPFADQIEEPLKAPVEKTPESTEKNEEQIKIRYYQVRAQIEKEPELIALKQQANAAISDEKKRQVLRAYYELLFKKMKNSDSSISNRCDVMEAAYLRRLEQATLEPTIPLSPVTPLSPLEEKKKQMVEQSLPSTLTGSKKKKHVEKPLLIHPPATKKASN